MAVSLDLDSLDKFVASLAAALAQYEAAPGDIMRDACIRRFDLAYHSSCMSLKHFLAAASANPSAFEGMSFRKCIQTGVERGVLRGDGSRWAAYRRARDLANDAYEPGVEDEVFALVPEFLHAARSLAEKLRQSPVLD